MKPLLPIAAAFLCSCSQPPATILTIEQCWDDQSCSQEIAAAYDTYEDCLRVSQLIQSAQHPGLTLICNKEPSL